MAGRVRTVTNKLTIVYQTHVRTAATVLHLSVVIHVNARVDTKVKTVSKSLTHVLLIHVFMVNALQITLSPTAPTHVNASQGGLDTTVTSWLTYVQLRHALIIAHANSYRHFLHSVTVFLVIRELIVQSLLTTVTLTHVTMVVLVIKPESIHLSAHAYRDLMELTVNFKLIYAYQAHVKTVLLAYLVKEAIAAHVHQILLVKTVSLLNCAQQLRIHAKIMLSVAKV